MLAVLRMVKNMPLHVFDNRISYLNLACKSQNMSNNSYVTADGREMGRAQGVQAEAARVEPQVFMNPILLKPRKDTSSEIVLNGKVFDAPCDKNYYRTFTLGKGLETMKEALAHIDKNFDLIIAEGAGSTSADRFHCRTESSQKHSITSNIAADTSLVFPCAMFMAAPHHRLQGSRFRAVH